MATPPLETHDEDPVPELLVAIELIDQAIGLADAVLQHGNPSKEEGRSLNKQLLRLRAERTALEADLNASLAGTQVTGPTAGQVAEMEALLSAAEAATNQVMATRATIAFAGKVLDLAVKIAKPTQFGGGVH